MSTELDAGPHWPEGYDLVVLDEVDSTMAEAARRAASIRVPTWIMALRQTAGRGRRGRAWDNPAGNLAATLISKPDLTPMDAALRSFLAANALFEALALYVDRTRLATKWPNDVLLDGGKVAGILLESSGAGNRISWLSIGIGVNLAHTPRAAEGATFAPVSLFEAIEKTIEPEEFLATLANAYATQEQKLLYFGFERIRRDWLAQAARLGEQITARTTNDEFTGTFDGIDDDGNLILVTAKGPKVIAAADVYF
ncbi:biotin--[acetyl-CoA-carboxylase] ligase [Marivivens aquimaris]|uniref:biotin--[acetyl-CoA-carboxylase] ligase n=1 Tax=Marivivens aquimaris TaxID=2774876 RepID=UPI00187FA32A|nr:biotin--[acetyl-CoA-carboxylase] ligase [Marivivens aquimaris]